MSDEKEFDIATAKDMFAVATVLNGLLDKFSEVSKDASSLLELKTLIQELSENAKADREATAALLEEVRNNQELMERVNKVTKDNERLTKENRELRALLAKGPAKKPAEPVAGKSSGEVPSSSDDKAPSKSIVDQALAVKKVCENQKIKMLPEEKVTLLLKTTKEEGKEVYEYLRKVGFVDNTHMINFRAAIRPKTTAKKEGKE